MTDRTEEKSHKKVYAAGYFTALRDVGIPDVQQWLAEKRNGPMNKARFKALFDGQSSIAKKVYGAIDAVELRTSKQIQQDLIRAGIARDFTITEGCINTLVDSGLVQEKRAGYFCRTPIKEKTTTADRSPEAPTNEEEQMAEATITQEEPQKQNHIDRLASLAGRVTNIAGMLATLSADIEAAALEIDSQIAADHAKMAKLHQLQSLLKELG